MFDEDELFTSYMDSLILGVDLRNSGNLDAAEKHLLRAAMLDINEWQPFFELGVLYSERGNQAKASSLFSQAFTKSPGEMEVIRALLSSCVASKDLAHFVQIVDQSNIQSEDGLKLLTVYYQLMDYVNTYHLRYAGNTYEILRRNSRGWQLISEVVTEIAGCLSNNTPYAFIRLGDGEGTWLHHSSKDEMRFNALYSRNRDEFWDIWYGEASAHHRGAFYSQMSMLAGCLGEADLIGVPPDTWIDHEFSIGSMRGIPGTLNVVRMLEQTDLSSTALCTQLMHYELGESIDFFDLLSSLDKIGIISCHPEIVDIVKYKFGIQEVVYLPIPGEPSRLALLGNNSIQGEHFPSAFIATLDHIKSIDWGGMLCLVGGGILGKQYCIQIKRQGGIAIDIGSIMDKWNNKKTRPDF
jgi:hypothetical protein